MLTCTKLGNGTTKTHLHEESVAGTRFTEGKAILDIEDGNSAAANTTTVIITECFAARSKDQPPSKPLSSSTQEHPPPFHVFVNKNPLRNNQSNLYEDSNWYHERDEVPDTWCPTQEEVDAIAHENFPGWTNEDFRKDMSKRVASPDFSDEDSDGSEVAQLSQPRSDNLNNDLQLSRAADGKSRGSARGRLISNVFADAKTAE
ncbi:hypothetical protein OEA41_002729 [Lepraria neglecta]|uniref:Uncharacterized protein n=1 Tax=Lepraria neglecta TaxID=209136 RepID=A0AAD9Z765_9LECA|nr:hypothetical protein OEA41_002729 [Lepraria neglecta]